MATHSAEMWMPKTESAGLPGPVSGQGHSKTVEMPATGTGRRRWIPPAESMPPIVQFVLSAMKWFRAKCASGAKTEMPLRLVAQLSLGGKRHVSVVEVGGMQFLVGGGAENVTVIVPIAAETEAHKTDARDADRELQS